MTTQSEQTKIAVLNQKVDDLRDDVREVKGMVGDKVATKEYVDDRVSPVKAQVKWLYGILGSIIVSAAAIIIGLAIK